MSTDLRFYLAEHRPLILKEFEMYQRRDRLPAIGQIVKAFYDKLGSPMIPDVTAKVIGHDEDQILLEDSMGWGFAISKTDWWQHVYVEEEPK